MSTNRGLLERLKISCFTRGIALSQPAVASLTDGGTTPLSVHEYATTGGVTLVLADGVYVNAPFDDWFEGRGRVQLDHEDGSFVITFEDEVVDVAAVLPLPGYIGVSTPNGRVDEIAMSHADRVRLSPIRGCAYDCAFCDLPQERYARSSLERMLEALRVAEQDDALPARHGLISGGSPGRAHYRWFEELCVAIAGEASVPFDIMMSPLENDSEFPFRAVDAGIEGFAINMELFGEVLGGRPGEFLRRKSQVSAKWFESFILAAVSATGGNGQVRSLVIAGLEPMADTLLAIEWLAERGVDPVISPFRPARNTKLSERDAPDDEFLRDLLAQARAIVARYDVRLGPRCVPCQHNTLAFPWDVEDRVGVVAR